MKKAWDDLKSFVTVAMIAILLIIVVASLLGANLQENILILVTNLITAVFTYYFTKKDENTEK
jgi:Na+(H+)/acetate symporter ActP